MDNKEIRLRIVECLVPVASRVDILDGKRLKAKLQLLERYIIGDNTKTLKKKE